MQNRSLPLDRVSGLHNSETGLTTNEASQRLQRFGPNDIVETPPHPWAGLLLDTARDPMLWFFAGTAALYWMVDQHSESISLLVAILPLIGMDFFLHRRTQASTEGLRGRLASTARVIRDGSASLIPAAQLVPGDLIIVRSGESIPADSLLMSAGDTAVQADESILTGEAFPVAKHPVPAWTASGAAQFAVAEESWLFAGTRVLTGEARLRIIFTGRETLYGEIVQSAVRGSHESTPLQAAIGRLVRLLLGAALVACAALAAVRLLQGFGWTDALISAVTLATAAIPEEFPVVFTFYLGVGVYRLARRQALVRRAVTVENMGRVTVVCSDKTGTITEGLLRLTHLDPGASTSESELLQFASFASRPDTGDPMDLAIFDRLGQASQTDQHRLATFPFTEDRKRETSVVTLDGQRRAVSKGAIEVILAMCGLDPADHQRWIAAANQFAAGGHKVIGVAHLALTPEANTDLEPASGFAFTGLLAFEDPIRSGVREAVDACKGARIHAMMVTGDHPLTARAIAVEAGLGDPEPRVIAGDEIDQQPDLMQVDVVARAKPAQKLQLVETLKRSGQVVAVTGDGVNDVPALQAADIGFAMGERGTRSAREVAAIILLDDNFKTIVRAIGEGRQLFRNLQLSFQYLLTIHIPLVLSATLIPLSGYPLLYLPLHIIWLEIMIHPTAMLVFQDLPARELVPRTSDGGPTRFFDRRQWIAMLLSGLAMTVLMIGGYLRSISDPAVDHGIDHGRAMALASLVMFGAAVTAALSQLRTPTSRLVIAAEVAIAVLLIQVPVLAHRLHLEPLHTDDLLLATSAGILAAIGPLLLLRWFGPRRP